MSMMERDEALKRQAEALALQVYGLLTTVRLGSAGFEESVLGIEQSESKLSPLLHSAYIC